MKTSKLKRELVIFIPGARTAETYPNYIRHLFPFFSWIFPDFNPIYHKYTKLWSKQLRKKDRDMITFHWSGGITPISKFLAVRKLKRLINHYKNTHNIKIVGISLGGDIALQALKSSEDFVEKLILIAPIIENKKFHSNKTKIFNIYSPFDSFEKLVKKIYAPISGGIRLSGKNVSNISLNNIDHESFCFNKRVTSGNYKGSSIIELTEKFLASK